MTDRVTVLVAEDDPLVSEVIASALEDEYAVACVGTSLAALEALRDGTAGLLLLDCTLPGGIDPALLAEADRTGVPVVLMSGDAARADNVAGPERPFLLKPFTLGALADAVAAVLSRNARL